MSDNTIVEPQCLSCYWLADWPNCLAFPDGIPEEIRQSRFDHRKPWPESREYPQGDHGLQFESMWED